MLRAKKIDRRLSAAGLRFGIAAARYNTALADALLANCVDTLAKAGADSAWVSKPMNSGPLMSCCLRYSHIDWLMARTWASLKLSSVELPRCPEVPKATRCAPIDASGRSL